MREQVVRHHVITPLLAATHWPTTSCSAFAAATCSANGTTTGCSTPGRTAFASLRVPCQTHRHSWGARGEPAAGDDVAARPAGRDRRRGRPPRTGDALAELAERGHDLVVDARSGVGARRRRRGAAGAGRPGRDGARRTSPIPRWGSGSSTPPPSSSTGSTCWSPTPARSRSARREFAIRVASRTRWTSSTTACCTPSLPRSSDEAAAAVLVISSISGKLPAPHLLRYVTAKHAAVGFAEGLRVEAIQRQIAGGAARCAS